MYQNVSSMLEQIMDRRNMEKALLQVERNKGAGGVDGMQTRELRSYLNTTYQSLRQSVLQGIYQPSAVRKVEIPKPDGGKRTLGIPTVIDRLLQQSISQWLSQFYEPNFSALSYGFRPNKSAHQAVLQAQTFLNEGYCHVIELDLEKFFDKVNHDKLMSLLMHKVVDKATLGLIRQYLRSGIIEGGVVSQRLEGTPQGSPLSPLLSNIMLHELDKELTNRGHRFVRYADDCSIYVKSEKAANRVLASVSTYIEQRLKLKVNKEKSKVSKPSDSTLLGFSFGKDKAENWAIRIAQKSINKVKEKCKQLTQRSDGTNVQQKITKLKSVIVGWVNYFSIAQENWDMQYLDAKVRVRLRMCIWKQWKNYQTRVSNLRKLKASMGEVYRGGYKCKSYIRIARSPILQTTLTNAYLVKQGYEGFYNTYRRITKATQPSLF